MLAYGWTFHMGFFNFYLSMGFAFAALAILRPASGLGYFYVLPLIALIWLAHPLGLLWLLSAGGYVLVAKHLTPRVQWLLFLAALACILPLRIYLSRHFDVSWWSRGIYNLSGGDQLILGARYSVASVLLLVIIGVCILLHFLKTPSEDLNLERFFPLALQLYLLMLLSLRFLPNAIQLPQYEEPLSFITERFTLGAAILGCCALANLRSRTPFAVLTGCLALFYFASVYQTAAKTYAMECQVDSLVKMVPEYARVITTIFPFRDSRLFNLHVADRACIGHCFNIGNYEAASRQFRLRANPGNHFAAASMAESDQMMLGIYTVKPEDLPLWQFFQCGPADVDMCHRPLHAGPLTRFSPAEAVRARK